MYRQTLWEPINKWRRENGPHKNEQAGAPRSFSRISACCPLFSLVYPPRVCKRRFPNGGSSFVGARNSATPFLPQFCLFIASFLPHLSPAQPAISNHGLETTVYTRLDPEVCKYYIISSKHSLQCNCDVILIPINMDIIFEKPMVFPVVACFFLPLSGLFGTCTFKCLHASPVAT